MMIRNSMVNALGILNFFIIKSSQFLFFLSLYRCEDFYSGVRTHGYFYKRDDRLGPINKRISAAGTGNFDGAFPFGHADGLAAIPASVKIKLGVFISAGRA